MYVLCPLSSIFNIFTLFVFSIWIFLLSKCVCIFHKNWDILHQNLYTAINLRKSSTDIIF